MTGFTQSGSAESRHVLLFHHTGKRISQVCLQYVTQRERKSNRKRWRHRERERERQTERHTCLALEQNPAYATRRHSREGRLIHKGLNVTWGWESLFLKLSSTCSCCPIAKSHLTLGDPMN